MDRKTYSRKTLDVYEVIAAFYVDMIYNHLYIEAKKLRTDGKVPNITTGYKHTLTAFLQGIEKPELYKKSLLGLHTFFIENGYSNLTFKQCIERVVKEFIPDDFYETLINRQKDHILRTVFNSVCNKFIKKTAVNYLKTIIDNHNEPDNVRILQDEFIDLLLLEREIMYKRFIMAKTKGPRDNILNITLVEEMQKEIKMLLTEKYNLKKEIRDLKKIIISKAGQKEQYESVIEKLNNTITELQNELTNAGTSMAANVVSEAIGAAENVDADDEPVDDYADDDVSGKIGASGNIDVVGHIDVVGNIERDTHVGADAFMSADAAPDAFMSADTAPDTPEEAIKRELEDSFFQFDDGDTF